MSLSAKLRRAPQRLVTGAYILNSGVSKLSADDEAAKGMHGMASGAYPFLAKVQPNVFIKGLAAGAVLGAVAALMPTGQDKDKKAKEIEKAAMRIKDKVAAHAKKLGKLTKTAYGKIVETTVAEYRGVKALSEDELAELREELKAGWTDVREMLQKKAPKRRS